MELNRFYRVISGEAFRGSIVTPAQIFSNGHSMVCNVIQWSSYYRTSTKQLFLMSYEVEPCDYEYPDYEGDLLQQEIKYLHGENNSRP